MDSGRRDWSLVAGALVLAALPALVFRYLPLTDFPQHLATLRILASADDPAWQLGHYYQVDYGRTLYLVPYLVGLGLGKLLGLRAALSVVTAVAMILPALGVALCLRALRRPVALTLLCVPFIYNRALFWGFLHFGWAVGLALITIAFILRPPLRGWRHHALIAGLCLLSALTHTYGIALLGAFALLRLLFDPTRNTLRSLLPLWPAGLGAAAWIAKSVGVEGYGDTYSPPIDLRLSEFESSILGGYSDPSEILILLVALGLCAWLVAAAVRAGAAADRVWRALGALVVLNLILYLVLPEHTPTAKFIHFRHAILAVTLLPLLAVVPEGRERLTRVIAAAVAVVGIGNAWVHWAKFDQEASELDAAIAVIDKAPRTLGLIYDADGEVMRTSPYLHSAAYIQAERGGALAVSFAKFWNVPIARRRRSPLPDMPLNFEWAPRSYDHESVGDFFNVALVRLPPDYGLAWDPKFPFVKVGQSGSFQIYVHREAPP